MSEIMACDLSKRGKNCKNRNEKKFHHSLLFYDFNLWMLENHGNENIFANFYFSQCDPIEPTGESDNNCLRLSKAFPPHKNPPSIEISMKG